MADRTEKPYDEEAEHRDIPKGHIQKASGKKERLPDPEQLRLLRVELVTEADPFTSTPSDTTGITFAEYQDVSGFLHPRSQVSDPDSSPYASWEREHLESELAYLRERAEALAEGRPTGGIPGIQMPDPQHEIEQIERYLRGEPEVAVITDVKVNSGPPPGAG